MAAIYEALEQACEMGITHFDVAPCYIQGNAEAILGNFLRNRNIDEVAITTKVGLLPLRRVFGRWTARRSSLYFLNKIQASLQNKIFGLERIDGADVRAAVAIAEKSLQRSLKELGREQVDTLLAHELPCQLLETEEFQTWISSGIQRGLFLRWGVGGYLKQYAGKALSQLGGELCKVIQMEYPPGPLGGWRDDVEYRFHGVVPLLDPAHPRDPTIPGTARYVVSSRTREHLAQLIDMLAPGS